MAYSITKKMFRKALIGTMGIKIKIAKNLEVTPSAVTQYLQRNEDMRDLAEKERLSMIDTAENELYDQLKFNDYNKEPASAAKIRQTAATYILGRLGKDKGWTERQEIEHSGSAESPININLIETSVEEIKDAKSSKYADKSKTD